MNHFPSLNSAHLLRTDRDYFMPYIICFVPLCPFPPTTPEKSLSHLWPLFGLINERPCLGARRLQVRLQD